jgi:hypothetical protein
VARQRGAGSDLPRRHAPAGALQGDRADLAALKQEWQRLRRMEVPTALSPDFLRRDIAYRQQANQHGGLSADARRRLAALASSDADQAPPPRPHAPRIKAGSTLLRDWRGRTYTVLALEQGFEMAGQRFASLSEVARHITGAHWSGPRFFGLRRGGGVSTPQASGEASGA